MADIEVDVTKWRGDWPLIGKATVHAMRMGIGGPPQYTREEQTVALLRLAAVVCTKTADTLESEGGEFTTHWSIPAHQAEGSRRDV